MRSCEKFFLGMDFVKFHCTPRGTLRRYGWSGLNAFLSAK